MPLSRAFNNADELNPLLVLIGTNAQLFFGETAVVAVPSSHISHIHFIFLNRENAGNSSIFVTSATTTSHVFVRDLR